MNREHKYKAKLLKSESWIHGYYIKQNGKHYIIDNIGTFWQIRIETLCQLITKIGDIEIYEYDCWYDKYNNCFVMFYYTEEGILNYRFYDTWGRIDLKNEGYIHRSVFMDSINDSKVTFIGNWHDGKEYLLKKIKEIA